MKRTSDVRARALKAGYRSGLEESLGKQLEEAGVVAKYEELKIEYIDPKTHRYTPDFVLPHNGIIIESKGRFLASDRSKHLLVKAQHPELDLRFVFTRSKSTLSKTSTTTYADWCIKHGFLYADKLIPEAWLKETK